jgi:hypothetical protein
MNTELNVVRLIRDLRCGSFIPKRYAQSNQSRYLAGWQPRSLHHTVSTEHRSQHQAHRRPPPTAAIPYQIPVTKPNCDPPLGATCCLTHGEPNPKLNSMDGAPRTPVLRNGAVLLRRSNYSGENPTIHSSNTVICVRAQIGTTNQMNTALTEILP